MNGSETGESRRPGLIVVSGPPGSGKTTLAHRLARLIGCPAVCRDEIKEGMALASSGTGPAADGELNLRTLSAFFEVLRVLLEAGATTVAEAAFQDHVWRPRLEPLAAAADVRIVHCVVDEAVARERIRIRAAGSATRRAHDDARAHLLLGAGFVRPALEVPSIEVDTTDGYAPGIEEIARFAAVRIA